MDETVARRRVGSAGDDHEVFLARSVANFGLVRDGMENRAITEPVGLGSLRLGHICDEVLRSSKMVWCV